MKSTRQQFFYAVATQFCAIILSALAAALLAFIQSIITSSAGSPIPATDPELAAAFGASIKGTHSYIKLSRLT